MLKQFISKHKRVQKVIYSLFVAGQFIMFHLYKLLPNSEVPISVQTDVPKIPTKEFPMVVNNDTMNILCDSPLIGIVTGGSADNSLTALSVVLVDHAKNIQMAVNDVDFGRVVVRLLFNNSDTIEAVYESMRKMKEIMDTHVEKPTIH